MDRHHHHWPLSILATVFDLWVEAVEVQESNVHVIPATIAIM